MRTDLGADGRAAVAAVAACGASPRRHLDRHAAHSSRGVLNDGPHLGNEAVLARHALLEHVDVIVRHALLRDQDLLGAVDDEVAALVVGALAQLHQLPLVVVREAAVEAPEHDRHPPDEDLGELLGLLHVLLLLPLAPHSHHGLLDVRVQVGRVPNGSHSGERASVKELTQGQKS